MAEEVCNVFFLCTGNSAGSILGEKLIDRRGRGRFKGYTPDRDQRPDDIGAATADGDGLLSPGSQPGSC